MRQSVGTKHEGPASNHKATSAKDRHDQEELDQQNLEAADNRLSHQDDHEEKYSSHQAGESVTVEKLQYSELSEWSLA